MVHDFAKDKKIILVNDSDKSFNDSKRILRTENIVDCKVDYKKGTKLIMEKMFEMIDHTMNIGGASCQNSL